MMFRFPMSPLGQASTLILLVFYSIASAQITAPSSNQPSVPVVPLSVPDLSAVPTEDIRDIRDPIAIPNPWWPLLLAATLGASFLLLGSLLYFFIKKKRRQPTPSLLSPYEQALKSLKAARVLIQPGCDKEFSIAISEAVRYFFERQFAIPAPESTTEEFLSQIRDHSLIKGPLAEIFSAFLQRCDLTKFACQSLGLDGMEDLYKKAERLIEEVYLKNKLQASLLQADRGSGVTPAPPPAEASALTLL